MRLLRLNRVNHCVMVPEDATHLGMLRQVKDYVTWGEADAETAELLRGDAGMLGGRKPLSKAALKEGGEGALTPSRALALLRPLSE
jgi:large subunit ribosomal protein L30